MKKLLCLFLVIISSQVFADKEYYFTLKSGIILKLITPDNLILNEAVFYNNGQIIIQDGVCIQLLPKSGQEEVYPIMHQLIDIVTSALMQWVYCESEKNDFVEEPYSYVAPIWEGPSILNIGVKSQCCVFANCPQQFRIYGGPERTKHHKEHLSKFTYNGLCPVCDISVPEHRFINHLSIFHFKLWSPK